jgi:vacuolar-type H+-ATPase subunit E/Vma4
MGVEGIIAVIEREADLEAARIVENAEREAQEVVAAAEAAVQARVDAAVERHGPEIAAGSRRRVNTVRLRILEERARADAARLTAVFDAAEERVTSIAGGADPVRWSSALSSLCLEALRSVGEGATVSVRGRDADAIAEAAATWRAQIVALGDEADPGLLVSSGDGRIEVDARLAVRLERARSLLAEAVAQQLHLEPVDRGQGTEPEA